MDHFETAMSDEKHFVVPSRDVVVGGEAVVHVSLPGVTIRSPYSAQEGAGRNGSASRLLPDRIRRASIPAERSMSIHDRMPAILSLEAVDRWLAAGEQIIVKISLTNW